MSDSNKKYGHDWARVCGDSEGLLTLSLVEFFTNKGKHFYYTGRSDISGAGTTIYTMFTTPAVGKVHAAARFNSEAEFTIDMYEGAVVTDNGTEIPTFNSNRSSDTVAGLKVYVAPTFSDIGDLIWVGRVGAGRDATVARDYSYSIAKPSTNYIFKTVKATGGGHFLDTRVAWFEHESFHRCTE